MTIRNIDAFMHSLWDWGFLDGCFGNTGIKVSDRDGMVDGQRIIAAIEAIGGSLALEGGRIVLRWRGDPPGIVSIIDRIRANRLGVVAALNEDRIAGP